MKTLAIPITSKGKIFFLQFGPNEALYGLTSMSQPYYMVNYGVSQLLTNVIKHKGITTTLAKCVTRCKHSICSLWHFLLCIFTTHPPPPSSLFYSTEINSLLPETGFRCFLQSTVLPSIKGGNYGLFLVTHSQWSRVKIYFLTQKS